MNSENRRSRIEDDDSLLASVAGVPLTRSARIGAGLVWAAFWSARALLTDALPYLNQGDWKSALLELIGENPFDQGFSICMAWLTIEVAVILWDYLKTGVLMLIAKTGKPFIDILVDHLPSDKLDYVAERVEKRRQSRKQADGRKSQGDDSTGE